MRRNDASTDPTRWTHAKLLRELRSKANLESYSHSCIGGSLQVDADTIREQTRVYRDSWLAPLLRAPAPGYLIRDLGTPPDRMAYVMVHASDTRLPGRWVTRAEATRFPTVYQAGAFVFATFGKDADITIEKAD